MKKLLAGAIITVAAIASSVGSASADTPPQTDITGVITENHAAVANANVSVLCNGFTRTDKTDAFGSYLAIFSTTECPFGTTAKVTAEKDGRSGVMTGTVEGITTKLNLAIVNVSIPEYGLLGAVAAGGAGVAMVAVMRRRQQGMML